MKKYYFLSWKEEKGPETSAFAPEDAKADHELIRELHGINKLPFKLHLIKLDVGQNGLIKSNDLTGIKEIWQDYQANSLAWPLMSETLKSVIEKNLTGNEQVDWITCKVKGNGEERPYFILRFNKMLDVLDMEKTMFVQNTDLVFIPVFAISKVNNYSIFSKPSSYDLWKITSGIYVSEQLKKAIQKEKMTGVTFEKVRVSE